MSKDDKDYSNYIQHLSTVSNSMALLAGFTFTTITVLLTLLPDPSLILAQITLFILVFLLSLLLYMQGWVGMESHYHCRNIPKVRKGTSSFNLLLFLSNILFAITVLFMFLLFNLIYLALATVAVQVLFLVLAYLGYWKPFMKYRKTISQNMN